MSTIALRGEVEEESPDALPLRDAFLAILDLEDLASFFGTAYEDLGRLIYGYKPQYKYRTFLIPKKRSGYRKISTPCKSLRRIQNRLKAALDEVYRPKASVHGFVNDRSIVTNADAHLRKRYVFNLDLRDFYGSIHFGRVRNLFMKDPFSFSYEVATVVAQICCFEGSLPAGAPTSPVVSNMIARKLDSRLQTMARRRNCTYSRYADDITFSFDKPRLPHDLVDTSGMHAQPGAALLQAIEDNGFEVNYEKVRLTGRSQRMEVTGLTVNEAVNVRRQYVRELSSMLHAWEKFGLDKAQETFHSRFAKPHSASGQPKSLAHVVHGKLAFLKSVRGGDDPLYNRLASRFNKLVGDSALALNVVSIYGAEESLWIVHANDPKDTKELEHQGSGFSLRGVGIVTCWHAVSEPVSPKSRSRRLLPIVEVSGWDRPLPRTRAKVVFHDEDRDLAILQRVGVDEAKTTPALVMSERDIAHRLPLHLLGFPGWHVGESYSDKAVRISALRTDHGVQKFNIDQRIDHGNSGGPLVDVEGKVAGVAVERSWDGVGKDGAIHYLELEVVVEAYLDDLASGNDLAGA
ncbi:MAG: reverse transcriptase domain-containing protein [Coriobacteriia bacterium]|nr:reverse transcriptase domain-containing protein [Coriobacteriia bacterium]